MLDTRKAVRTINRNALSNAVGGTGSDVKQGVETPSITRLRRLHMSHISYIYIYIYIYRIVSDHTAYHVSCISYHHVVYHITSYPVVSFHEVCMTVGNVRKAS